MRSSDPEDLRKRATEIEEERREEKQRAREAKREQRQEQQRVQQWFRSLPQEHVEILANDPDSQPPEPWFWSQVFLDAPGNLAKSEGIELAQHELDRRERVETSAPRQRASAAAAFDLSPVEWIVGFVILLLVLGGDR